VAPSVIQKAPDVYVQGRVVGGQEYSFRQVSDLAAGTEQGWTGLEREHDTGGQRGKDAVRAVRRETAAPAWNSR
jgi:hypothetical protein